MVEDIRATGTRDRIKELAKEYMETNDNIFQVVITRGDPKIMYSEFYQPRHEEIEDTKICEINKPSQRDFKPLNPLDHE